MNRYHQRFVFRNENLSKKIMDSFSIEFGSEPTVPKPVSIAQQDCLFPISHRKPTKSSQEFSNLLSFYHAGFQTKMNSQAEKRRIREIYWVTQKEKKKIVLAIHSCTALKQLNMGGGGGE